MARNAVRLPRAGAALARQNMQQRATRRAIALAVHGTALASWLELFILNLRMPHLSATSMRRNRALRVSRAFRSPCYRVGERSGKRNRPVPASRLCLFASNHRTYQRLERANCLAFAGDIAAKLMPAYKRSFRAIWRACWRRASVDATITAHRYRLCIFC